MSTTEVMAVAPAFALALGPLKKLESHPIHIEDFAGGVSAASEEVKSGKSSLRLSVYPWGVEFDILRQAAGSPTAQLKEES